MDLGQFWRIIDVSRKGSQGDPDAQMDLLHEEVRKLSVEEVVSFGHLFDTLRSAAYRWDLWGAAYLIGGGCSDDGFIDFRSWLVSRGKKVYEAALKDPDSLAKILDEDEDGQIEGYQYIAMTVWGEKTGEDEAKFPTSVRATPVSPLGTQWSDEDLPRLFPKIYRKFGDG